MTPGTQMDRQRMIPEALSQANAGELRTIATAMVGTPRLSRQHERNLLRHAKKRLRQLSKEKT